MHTCVFELVCIHMCAHAFGSQRRTLDVRASGTCRLRLHSTGMQRRNALPGIFACFSESNSGLRSCKASTVPTKPSLQNLGCVFYHKYCDCDSPHCPFPPRGHRRADRKNCCDGLASSCLSTCQPSFSTEGRREKPGVSHSLHSSKGKWLSASPGLLLTGCELMVLHLPMPLISKMGTIFTP